MKHTKCKICGKEHALGGCPEFIRVQDAKPAKSEPKATAKIEAEQMVQTHRPEPIPHKPKIGRPRTGFNKKEYNRQFTADLRTIKRLGLNCTVAEFRRKNAGVQ